MGAIARLDAFDTPIRRLHDDGMTRSSEDRTARILVVEDEHVVALDIRRHLEGMGHDVVVVHSGEAAVAAATDSALDLVLMDIKLPGSVDGIEAARSIKSAVDLPIIYLTAYADNQTLERARTTDPYGYVMKPFQESELRATIDMALHKHGSDTLRWEQQQVQRFLSDASNLLASSLDYEAVAKRASELLVPLHADWCAIHLLETHDAAPAFVVTRPNGLGLVKGADKAPIIDMVLRSGRDELITHLADNDAVEAALGSRHLDVLRNLGARSLLCVPLVARRHIVGALALVSGRMRERFRVEDLAFAGDFAHRLALALDNALLYRKAARAVEMRDDVLAIVSHDLRTPLNVILLQTDMLVADTKSAAVGKRIEQAAHQMNRLIGDLLEASAINAGRLSVDCGLHDVDSIVQDTVEMFAARARAAGVTLTTDCEADLPQVLCDRDRIIQLLSNLLGNALKFTPAGGTVRVEARIEGERVHLAVADTGSGIPASQVPHLFERFWRAQDKRGGVGLGLFISQGIALAHGCALGVHTKVGHGSRFFFSLPTRR